MTYTIMTKYDIWCMYILYIYTYTYVCIKRGISRYTCIVNINRHRFEQQEWDLNFSMQSLCSPRDANLAGRIDIITHFFMARICIVGVDSPAPSEFPKRVWIRPSQVRGLWCLPPAWSERLPSWVRWVVGIPSFSVD